MERKDLYVHVSMYIDFYIYQHHVSAVHIDNYLSSRHPKNPLGVHPILVLSGIPELERGYVRENTGRTLWLSEGLGTEPILAIINLGRRLHQPFHLVSFFVQPMTVFRVACRYEAYSPILVTWPETPLGFSCKTQKRYL